MKRLLILRHAKSSWDDSSQKDFDRPLAPRGERDAPKIGAALRERGVLPDIILSSTAVRAKQTTEIVVKSARLEVVPTYISDLYGASASELIDRIHALPPACECAMFVGHNPGHEELVARLAHTHRPFPTAALACMSFDSDAWNAVKDGRGKLEWMIIPKDLESGD